MKKMIRTTLILVLIANTCLVRAQADSSATKDLRWYPTWMLIVPGATYFSKGRIGTGLLFSSLEVSGFALGIAYNKSLSSNSSSPYYNFPLLLGMSAYNIDKCDWVRNNLEFLKYKKPDFQYDERSFSELLKTPFQPKNVFTPIVGGFVLLAGVQLALQGHKPQQGFSNVDQMYFVNRYMKRNEAMLLYGATSLGLSYGAGVSEEYFFRNYLMPVLDYRYGQNKGLVISSGVFGGLHLLNQAFSNKPDIVAGLYQAGAASVLGYILGKNVQNRGYDIGPAIAAHMWYNFTLMLGSFLVDPKNNFLGVNVRFEM